MIYVYGPLNRQVVSGAQGSTKHKYIKTMEKGSLQLSCNTFVLGKGVSEVEGGESGVGGIKPRLQQK